MLKCPHFGGLQGSCVFRPLRGRIVYALKYNNTERFLKHVVKLHYFRFICEICLYVPPLVVYMEAEFSAPYLVELYMLSNTITPKVFSKM